MVSSLFLAAHPDTNNLSAEPNLINTNMGSNIGVFAFSDMVMYINWLHVDIRMTEVSGGNISDLRLSIQEEEDVYLWVLF